MRRTSWPGLRYFIMLIALIAAMPLAAQPAPSCGCMDVALVIDDTGSMGLAIDNVKAGLASIITTAQAASGGDVQFALLSFADSIEVDQDFTSDGPTITAAVNALSAWGGDGEAEASDQAVQYAVDRTTTAGCSVYGTLGDWRGGCLNIIVLVTDAPPGGCNDWYEVGIDDVNAAAAAADASLAGILISAVDVDDGYSEAEEAAIMMTYATVTGGVYVTVPWDGSGTGSAIEEIIADCGSESNECPNSHGYWKNHTDLWPITEVTFGGQTYSSAEMLALLTLPTKGDQSVVLGRQLIASLLNIANGSDPAPIQEGLAYLDAYLAGMSKLPFGSKYKNEMFPEAADYFDWYNNRWMTPECVDSTP